MLSRDAEKERYRSSDIGIEYSQVSTFPMSMKERANRKTVGPAYELIAILWDTRTRLE